MRAKVELRLLGPFQIDGKPGKALRRKERAILAYLALSSRPLSRYELANFFCQVAADPGRTLRLGLSRLRRTLGQGVLLTQDETVRLNPECIWADFQPFQALLTRKKISAVTLAELEAVIPLYRGEFLEGLYLPDAPEFDIWLVGQRSYWSQLYERGALIWLRQLIAADRFPEAIPIAQQLVRRNSLLEAAHYHLIWLYAQIGQRTAASQQYDQCRIILETELAVEPTPELQALHEDLLAGRLSPQRETQPRPTAAPLWAIPSTDFVGREEAWESLDTAWRAVQKGQPRILWVTAEAGGGKTRLIQEWSKTLAKGVFYNGACYESSQNLAFRPWISLLVALYQDSDAAAVEALPSPWFDALARLLPGLKPRYAEAEAGQPDQLFSAVRAMLTLAPSPLVLLLDDLQWVDAASLQLLQYLAASHLPILLIGAYRREESADNPDLFAFLQALARNAAVATLVLEPFSPETVSKLIYRLWPQLPNGYREPHLRDQLMQSTGGNPLFVSEIVHELAGADRLPDVLPVPPSLSALIQRRLHQLPTGGRQVLEALAIMDQDAEFDLIRQVSGRSEEEALEALELGLRWRLLRTTANANIDFKHDLMRRAVHQQLSPMRRKVLHRRAALIMAQNQVPAATLADHWGQAGDRDQEARYAALAGSQSATLYAYQEAVHYFRRALDWIKAPHQRPPLLLQLGDALVVLGQWEEAELLYEQGLALVTDGQIKAALQAAMGALLEYKGEYGPALQWVQSAIDFYKVHDDWEQLVRLLGYYGRIQWRQGNYQAALRTYQNALEISSRLPTTRPLIRLHNNIGLVYWQQQKYDLAMEHFHQTRRMAEAHQHKIALAIALGNLGNVHKDLGEFDQTRHYYQQALALDTELGNKMGVARHLGNLGVLYNDMGEHDKAIGYFKRALQIDETLGHQEGVARHIGNLGSAYYRKGSYTETLAYFGRALEIDLELGNQAGVALHVGNMGSVYKLLGEPQEALPCLVYAARLDAELGNKTGMARHLGNLADLFLFLDQPGEALAWCQRAIRLQKVWKQDYHLSWNLWLQGVIYLTLDEYGPAVRSLRTAQELAEVVTRPDVLVACQALLPRLRVLAGEISTAAALEKLNTLFVQAADPRQRAAILYEQWRLEPETWRQDQVREAYLDLLEQSPTAEARGRAREVGATELPEKPNAPPLPELLSGQPVDLAALLDQVNQNLTSAS